MAWSIRAREIMARRAAEKATAKLVAQREQEQREADYHAAFYDRERAAAFIGCSVHRLKRLMAAGTGPACIKRGDTKQATVRWPLAELEAWKADPRGYNAAQASGGD
jgi:predicted DNA-binding transcriptional regulator AlpA